MSREYELESLIRKHKAYYYNGRPEISDSEYDALEDELKKINPKNPVLSLVGATPTGKAKIKHDRAMLSLNKTYKADDLKKWIDQHEVVSTYKVDGVSCSLIYKRGNLEMAKTRGDGQFGENILDKMAWLEDVPGSIKDKIDVEIRGEVYCAEDKFLVLSDEMETQGLARPTSQRNIVAGLLGRKDHVSLAKHLNFFAFDVITDDLKIKKEYEKKKLLEQWRFSVPDFELHKNTKKIDKILKDTEDFMVNGHYQIDGLVFSYNDIDLQEELGATAHHPRFKMAFKYQGLAKETKIKSLTWQVSRNGVLTPVAEVEPVELSGATINRVTLHNYGVVHAYQLKSGDTIEIIRSGEVIPKFLQVIKSSKKEYLIPEVCPSCEENVVVEDIRILCKNPKCPAQNKEEILYFVKKIGIDDISIKRLEEMLNKEIISEVPDLYKLELDDFYKLDKVKEKLANKMYENIQASKKANLLTFLSALGISGGAINKCEKIINSGFNTLTKIRKLSVEKLSEVEGFADKSSEDFLRSLDSKKSMIDSLLEQGFKAKHESTATGEILSGKQFVITGTLTRKRSEIEKAIKDNGGIVSSSVSKNTSFLVTNDKESSSSKFKKAKNLGLPIITEDELFSKI